MILVRLLDEQKELLRSACSFLLVSLTDCPRPIKVGAQFRVPAVIQCRRIVRGSWGQGSCLLELLKRENTFRDGFALSAG